MASLNSYDMSWLPLAEAALTKMLADQNTTASLFVGGNQPWVATPTGQFTGTYNYGPGGSSSSAPAATTETTSTIQNRLNGIQAMLNRLAR